MLGGDGGGGRGQVTSIRLPRSFPHRAWSPERGALRESPAFDLPAAQAQILPDPIKRAISRRRRGAKVQEAVPAAAVLEAQPHYCVSWECPAKTGLKMTFVCSAR